MTRIAIFASGAGSNAHNIIRYFRDHPQISVALIVTNNPSAGVINIANLEGIPHVLINRERFFYGDAYLPVLGGYTIDFIVLAGFLWKVPPAVIEAFPQRIVNIHPALLPLHGGRGMYGMNVHRAVIEAGEKYSGITIHLVDEQYDNGDILFQERCPVTPGDTPESLAEKVHALEYAHFPRVIEDVIGQSGSMPA